MTPNEALARKCALEAFPQSIAYTIDYCADEALERCVRAILAFDKERQDQRDQEWLNFMQSRMWDGAVAISKRDFLKLPEPPKEEG